MPRTGARVPRQGDWGAGNIAEIAPDDVLAYQSREFALYA